MHDQTADEDEGARTCCGVTRTRAGCRITHPVHLDVAVLVIICCLLSAVSLFVDVGLHRVSVSTVTENGHASSSIVAGIFGDLACLLSAHQIQQTQMSSCHDHCCWM
jgi:hypothetical protein